ncbi:MAG: hypothetical protein FWB88_12335 [Defluviitaleaceae bacterium]|nr:hypothetical protein [Defluviitaleaceae bacterium]MCL2240404.1 hypothetical protein [Defluviitaleaceae bacterium]
MAKKTDNVGTLEATKELFKETAGTQVQNAEQNKQIHKQALGPNAKR